MPTTTTIGVTGESSVEDAQSVNGSLTDCRGRGNKATVRAIAMPAPRSWAARNGSTEAGAMPAKVSVKMRPMVTAGFANEVELVN
jgi:hypothetical protein